MRINNGILNTRAGSIDAKILSIDVSIFIFGYVACIVFLWIPMAIVTGKFVGGLIAMVLGVMLWSLIFFVAIFPRCVRRVRDNEVWIMANSFVQEIVQSGGAINRNRSIRAQRPIQSGLNFVLPWEYLARDGIVNMTKRTLGDEEDSDSYQTFDGNQISLEYEFFWAVIPGYEINFFRFHEEGGNETHIAEYLRGLMRAFLQAYCIARTLNDIMRNLHTLNVTFVNTFLCERELLDIEERMGVQITDAYISRATASAEVKQIAESQRDVMALSLAAEDLRKKNKSFSEKEAMNYTLLAAGKGGVDVRSSVIDENWNFTGLPKNLQVLSKGEPAGVPQNKPANKPGKNDTNRPKKKGKT